MNAVKRRRLWFIVSACSLFLSIFISCNEEESVFGDDFECPELTDENTIRFTVEVTGDWRQLSLSADGGRMVVEWGDGHTQKIEDPGSFPAGVKYQYDDKGVYQVRIWAEEVEHLVVGDALLFAKDLQLPVLPKVKYLTLNNLTDTKELDLNVCCPNVERINIGNCTDLEQLKIDQCLQLRTITIYANPNLVSVQLGNYLHLTSFTLNGNGEISSLSLKGYPALKEVDCSNNQALNRLELDDETEITSLSLSQCAFTSIADILECCPYLTTLYCSSNQLTNLDLSDCPFVTYLDCRNNQLTNMDVAEGSLMLYLYCHSNQLSAEALNDLFGKVGEVPFYYSTMYSIIAYNDNPGADTCDSEVLLEKGWTITKKLGD